MDSCYSGLLKDVFSCLD